MVFEGEAAYTNYKGDILKAWELLCEDTANSLHQFDFWEEVPSNVQELYLNKVKEK